MVVNTIKELCLMNMGYVSLVCLYIEVCTAPLAPFKLSLIVDDGGVIGEDYKLLRAV